LCNAKSQGLLLYKESHKTALQFYTYPNEKSMSSSEPKNSVGQKTKSETVSINLNVTV
jgi:hypothetical protein